MTKVTTINEAIIYPNQDDETMKNDATETMKEPMMTIQTAEPLTYGAVHEEEVRRNGKNARRNGSKVSLYTNGKVPTDRKKDVKERNNDESNPRPTRENQPYDMSWGSESYEDFVQFEEGDSVEWNRMILDKDIDDDSLCFLIREYSDKVTSSQTDFIKICMETMQLRNWQFLGVRLEELNYSKSSVSKIKAICGNKALRRYIDVLPSSWGALYELKKCTERQIEELLGLLPEQKEVGYTPSIHKTSSKGEVKKELNKLIPPKTDDELAKEYKEWFEKWTQTVPVYFDLSEANDILDKLTATQKNAFVEWFTKSETLFTQKEFPTDFFVNLRVKK